MSNLAIIGAQEKIQIIERRIAFLDERAKKAADNRRKAMFDMLEVQALQDAVRALRWYLGDRDGEGPAGVMRDLANCESALDFEACRDRAVKLLEG